MTFRPIQADDHVLLIDGSSFLWRAFYGSAAVTRRSDGHPVGAISGFCWMIWTLLHETPALPPASHRAMIFDAGRRNWRHEILATYKANRSEPPDDIKRQFGPVRAACAALPIPMVELAGYEADDLIATYTRKAVAAGAGVTIATGDKDLAQLVDDRAGVCLYDASKGKTMREAEVLERFSVPPAGVLDFLALAGDTTDNIPGVPGIGAKRAAELVSRHGTVEDIIAAGAARREKQAVKVAEHAESARVSRRLAALDSAVPVPTSLAHLGANEPDTDAFGAFLEEWDLGGLAERLRARAA
ncbi:5'-3' exonuclease H3TH domain-containing protein [Xanthobacter flavus]|uniref:5'-3' exonuclease n=1 Tax=Xanthobacter flavus TaxID=281 RepID=UPI00372C0404